MTVSIIIATYGDDRWEELSWTTAYPSTINQGATETLVVHQQDETLAQVRNRGSRLARGDWLCFLDADDQLADGYLDAMRKTIDEKFSPFVRLRPDSVEGPRTAGHSLLVPAVQYVEDGRCVAEPAIPAWGRPLIDINCAVIGTLVPRELFLRVGGFREFPRYEDWDLWLRCVIAGATMIPVPEAVYCATHRQDGRNTTGDLAATYHEIRDEHLPAYADLR